jgi:hypothetical protein
VFIFVSALSSLPCCLLLFGYVAKYRVLTLVIAVFFYLRYPFAAFALDLSCCAIALKLWEFFSPLLSGRA